MTNAPTNYGEGNKMIKLVEPMDKNLVSDIHLVIDLSIFAVNVARLYRQIWSPCKANLFKKYLKGNYDPMLARKMFYNHVPKILASYEKEFCSKGFKINLPKYDKEFLANEILDHYVCDFEEEKKALEDKS